MPVVLLSINGGGGMKKLLLFVAGEKGFTTLAYLLKKGYAANIGAVATFSETGVIKDWSREICAMGRNEGIPVYFWRDIKTILPETIARHMVTGAIAIGWRYMLPISLNGYLEDPIIILHDSLLPRYRGFAPTPTAIMQGETETGITAFFATESVDSGDIVLQRRFYIPGDMYIGEVIRKESSLYAEMTEEIIRIMEWGKLTGVPQDDSMASYSIWRDEEDYRIDWSKDSVAIYNFVRALGYPYAGAFSYYDGECVRVSRAEVIPDLNFEVRDAGKIWNIHDNHPEVICGRGMLRILNARDWQGKEFAFDKLRVRLK